MRGDIRRVVVRTMVWVEYGPNDVRFHEQRDEWYSPDEMADPDGLARGTSGQPLPIEPGEPLRAMGRTIAEAASVQVMRVAESVSKVRSTAASAPAA